MNNIEPKSVSVNMEIQFNYSAGEYFSRFFREIRDNGKIFGVRCPECGKVYLPPRPVCGDCFAETDEWVELGRRGTIEAWTVVYLPILDGATGRMREAPYGMALIKLDGCDTTLNYYLDEKDPEKLCIGMRVEAVFREERNGNIGDILYFKVLEAI